MKEFFKKNYMFIYAFILLVLAVYVAGGIKMISINPFEDMELVSPTSVYIKNDKKYCISNDSGMITVADKDNNLVDIIKGGAGKLFSNANELVVDDEGNIYVHDKRITEGGSYAYFEEIIAITPGSNEGQVLYSLDTVGDSSTQIRGIKKIYYRDNGLSFIVADSEGIHAYRIDKEGELSEIGFYSMEDAYASVSDATVDSNGTLAYSMMNGDVYTWHGGEAILLYDAREHDTEDYFSIISELDYDRDGTLYLCDAGLRQIYKVEADGSVDRVIPPGTFSRMGPEVFAELPRYAGFDVSDGVICVLVEEYIYDDVNDEEIYYYGLGGVDTNGQILFHMTGVSLSVELRLYILSLYGAVLAIALLIINLIIRAVRLMGEAEVTFSVKAQLIMVVTALFVTCFVSFFVYYVANGRFETEIISKLANVSYLVANDIDKELIRSINSPDDYFREDYSRIDDEVLGIIENKVNSGSGLYCVLYRVVNDVVCEIYRDGAPRGAMYPMAGRYSGSIEEYIALNNDYDVEDDFSLSEGTYMYALVPVYDEGECIAYVEIGTDYGALKQTTDKIYSVLLVLIVMGVIIISLLGMESGCFLKALKERGRSLRSGKPVSPDVIRPLSFLFFLVANLSTAFLPVYGMELWDESIPFDPELAAAMPLTAELICAAVSAFAFGFVIKRLGVRTSCMAGALMYVAGHLLSAFAPDLWVLIGANSLCGIGSGILSITFNSWAAGYDTEGDRNKGFLHINSAYLAGLNCGTVIGSCLREVFGITPVFMIGAACALIMGVLSVLLAGKASLEEETENEAGGSLKELFTPRVIRYFVCILAPYLICTAFLEYFLPIEGDMAGLSSIHISLAFLISGLISIYTGSSLAEPITARIGVKRAMVFASFLYAMALFYLALNPTIYSCYVVVVVFAIADSFGISAQSVYYSALPEVEEVGQSKALGVNNTVESITSACGSLIFGAALMLGTGKGILIIALVFAGLMGVYAVGEMNIKRDLDNKVAKVG